MEKDNLESTINIAYMFLEKSCIDSTKISYDKLQCMIYQANKTYFHYKNKLLCNINTITSKSHPINMDILKKFSLFKDKDHISYVPNTHNISMDLIKSIFLEYIWYKYSPMNDEELLKYTLKDKVFKNSLGIDIYKSNFKDEKKDTDIKIFMDFLIR